MAQQTFDREVNMKQDLLLSNATVQEIQLELIRRTSYNDFDGQKVYKSLMRHHDLWQAVLLDRPGIANYAEPSHLLMCGLIKLRDLDDNLWNADTLFILTRTREQARAMRKIIDEEGWGGEALLHENQQELDRALGTGRQEYGLVTIWWD